MNLFVMSDVTIWLMKAINEPLNNGMKIAKRKMIWHTSNYGEFYSSK